MHLLSCHKLFSPEENITIQKQENAFFIFLLISEVFFFLIYQEKEKLPLLLVGILIELFGHPSGLESKLASPSRASF